MSSYLELVKFEYKKILRKRSTIIILVIGILLTAISGVSPLFGYYYVDGKILESHYEGMKKDREYRRGLSGREINRDLLSETIEAYSRVPVANGRYSATEEYQEYARPYSGVFYIISHVYNLNSNTNGVTEMLLLTEENLNKFYDIRQSMVERNIENTTMSPEEKAKSKELSRKVKTPFIYSYTGGYTRFLSQMYVTAILICFICLICISPLFAGEYTNGMDGLIFSSKYGKNKVIRAKLFTGISLTILFSVLLIIASYVTIMTVFGWDGKDAPIQLQYPLSIVPLTMGQVALLYSAIVIFGNILSSSLTMVLSAKLKSPYIVLVIMTALTIIPAFVNVSDSVLWIYHLSNLIPVKMFDINNVISIFSINFPGLTIQPYVLIISFAAVASMALLPLVYRNFKKT